MYYYSFHITDYRAATAHLSNDEDLAYRRLIDMYYDTEQPIPVDTQWVSKRLRVGIDTIQSVLEDMFVLTDDGWRHTRCDEEIQHYHQLAERNRTNGKLGGRPRSKPENPEVTQNNPDGSQRQPTGKPTNNHKPLTNNQKPENKQPAFECPSGVLPDVWNDFVKQRKAKKAAITETALNGIEREARKANMSLNAALQEICARGWTGFKAEWVKTDEQKKMTPHAASMKAAGIAIFGNLEEQYEQRAAIDITPTQPATRFLGAEDIRDDAGSLRDTVDEHVEDRSDFI